MSTTYTQILAEFNDITRDASRYYFTTAQVDRFAARALTETCERARYKTVSQVINVVGGTMEYAVSTAGYDVLRAEYNDTVLLPIARDALRTCQRDWASRSGLPRFYFLDEMYDSQEYLTVGLWENPSASLTSGLRVWYHAQPTAPLSTGEWGALEVDIPEWAAGALLFYMLYLAYTSDTKAQNFETAAIYKLMYEDILERLVLRSRDANPKKWAAGAPASPTINVLNRLPQRITE